MQLFQGANKAKTLIPKKYALKPPTFFLNTRFFALKPLNLYLEKWLVLTGFGMIRLKEVQKQIREQGE